MKLGLGLYRHMLTAENYQFARQCGCTHIVAHYVDYFNHGTVSEHHDQPTGGRGGWGFAGDPDRPWTYEELSALKRQINEHGLELAAIENFDPAHWYDVLLDGPKKQQQLENLKTIIRNVGRAGIPVIGYNFSIAGVAGRTKGPYARAGAESVGMEGEVDQTPVPRGMVWNMIYDRNAPEGTIPQTTHEDLWRRLDDFLQAVLPVAEEAGVTLAAHPDDPPVPVMRQTPRLVYQPRMYQRLLDLHPSRSNALEFCLGSLAEMTEGDIYEVAEQYAGQQRLAYVHFRNVHGKVPSYRETFVDDGDIDMFRVLRILHKNGFDGVLIPDHTPQLKCAAPWHAGMAYALGWMQAALRAVTEDQREAAGPNPAQMQLR
jgi:mannonate dehydratase